MTTATSPRAIRSPALRRALIGGAHRVIAGRDGLNRINVFPVADGDTGNNLAFTMGSVLSGALSRRAAGVGELLRRVGEDAVDGGRGNSGAILAQFLTGVASDLGDRIAVAPARLAQAVQAGARAAREAVAEPREGTMLSVIAAFAESLEASEDVRDPRAWFGAALERARRALAHTPQQLPVLLKAGVVDAGAQGFVHLLEGIDAVLGGESVALEVAVPALDPEHLHADDALADADPAHRWCSECLISGSDLHPAAMREAVAGLGASCIVVAGSTTRMRLHAHVASPQALFEVAARFGQVESTKADDMQAQARSAAGAGAVAIVTDSSADLPEGLAEALHLHVVPLRLNFGEQDYLDKVGMTPAQFYARLRQSDVLPRTSQPAPGDFRRQFDFLLAHHPAVVYIGVARAVSGTIQSAETAAQRGDPARTFIVDSANAAGGQALLAIAAAEAAREGADAAAIVARLEALRPRTLTWAMTRDLTMPVRGGRLPAWSKTVVELLGLVPIARVKPVGRLGVVGGLFGRRRLVERFAGYIARRLPEGARWRLIVGHCDAAAEGAELLQALRERLPCTESWLVETGPAIGAHAGPGTLVVSVQPLEG
ncbi:DegV family protein [Dyella lutea]|uniref:DegV family EDD domain-containing protein n=1 Tax=Dyella lutea TaxID=2950441 RepID=A0ABT1FBK0_9GAMM|nr:DegV family protein [Dyella lutea]MCP1374761.1 DegV family EDD domain-containing protein [Dyella lutea]